MNDYIIPANSKKSILIMGMFRSIDLTILLIGGFITTVLLFVLGDSLLEMIIKLTPLGVAIFLVFPIPYYHNVLVFLQELYLYIQTPTLHWRGWCASYEFTDDDNK